MQLSKRDYLYIRKVVNQLVKSDTSDAKVKKSTQKTMKPTQKDIELWNPGVRENVAILVWNNYDEKKGVELKNLKADVKNITRVLE
eukprot:508713-Amorphochlora_amoeboformis.AAC.1